MRDKPYPKNNILAISFCPICQKKIQQSALVNIAEPLSRWKVICHVGAWCHLIGTDGVERVVFMVKAAAKPVQEAMI